MLATEGFELVEALGLRVPVQVFVRDRNEAGELDLSVFPGEQVVLKAASPAVAHKTDVGAVAVVPAAGTAVRAAMDRMARRLAGFPIYGYTIAEFIPHAEGLSGELLVGLRQTDDFGPVVVVGPGGVHAELLARHLRPGSDLAVLAPPLSAERMVELLADKPATRIAGGLGWVAFLFAANVALNQTWMRELRNHGQRASPPGFARIGLNSRLDTIQAAVLLAKLRVFDDEIAARNRLAAFYDHAFAGLAAKGLVVTPPRVAGTTSVWAQYGIQCRNRDRVAERLRALGIPTAVHYRRPVHLQPAYEAFGDGPGSLPATEHVSARILCLPMHPYMEEATAGRITDGVITAVEEGEAAA